jgi:hypothetical protein
MEHKSETKICQNCKQDFIIEPEDFLFYEKIKVPAPTFCSECRMKRRMLWRNERIFYHRVCDSCGEKSLSVFKDKNLKIFCQKCWWADSWDAINYGKEYNFSESFFNQFLELFRKVPQINLNGHATNKNSDYVNYIIQANQAYLCFGGGYLENVLFSNVGIRMKDSAEILFSNDCELCYEIVNCSNCYKLCYGNNLQDCIESYFLQDCVNCNNCIMSCNLRNESYVIKNKKYSKEDYFIKKEEFLKELNKDVSKIKEEFRDYLTKFPKKFSNILKSEFSTGNNILESSNVKNSFNVSKSRMVKYSQDIVGPAFDIYDSTSVGINLEKIFESMSISMNASDILFSVIARSNPYDLKYSFSLHASSHLFACVGLRNKQYCILNKQYTKEQYEELVPKIIQHMNDMPYIDSKGRIYKYGEFFPPELSPFCYNETVAQEYFPLTKEQALEQGYKWKDREERNYNIDIKTEEIPDNIQDVDESIIGKVIECQNKGNEISQCTEAFKIIESEFQFYKRMNLPIPRFCPNCRHYNRLKQRNPLKLWHRKCMNKGCNNEFETSYAPDRPEIIYCEDCYKKEVY